MNASQITASTDRVLEILRARALADDSPHHLLLRAWIEAAFWQAAAEHTPDHTPGEQSTNDQE